MNIRRAGRRCSGQEDDVPNPKDAVPPIYHDLSWTPDGHYILFGLDNIEARNGIWRIAPDGTGFHQLTTAPDELGPEISPNGRYLVVDRTIPGGLTDRDDLWLTPAEGGPGRWLTSAKGADEQPSWAPDSRHLVFTSQRGSRNIHYSSATDLYVLDVATGKATRLLRQAGNEIDPAWQP